MYPLPKIIRHSRAPYKTNRKEKLLGSWGVGNTLSTHLAALKLSQVPHLPISIHADTAIVMVVDIHICTPFNTISNIPGESLW